MLWERTWTGQDILKQVGFRAAQKVDICSASALRNSPYPTTAGAGFLEGRSVLLTSPEPFFCARLRFRELKLGRAGSGGGWWGWRGSGTQRGRRFVSFGWIEYSERRPTVWLWRGCARLDGAWRQ